MSFLIAVILWPFSFCWLCEKYEIASSSYSMVLLRAQSSVCHGLWSLFMGVSGLGEDPHHKDLQKRP